MTARHGTLWVVKEDMLADSDYKKTIGERKVLIEKGEVIEWRYESQNHFRTTDDKWFVVNDEVFEKHCLLIGRISENVKYNNIANREEIFRLRLFEWSEDGRNIFNKLKKEIEEE